MYGGLLIVASLISSVSGALWSASLDFKCDTRPSVALVGFFCVLHAVGEFANASATSAFISAVICMVRDASVVLKIKPLKLLLLPFPTAYFNN